jgi:hypothetical protein
MPIIVQPVLKNRNMGWGFGIGYPHQLKASFMGEVFNYQSG